VTTDDKVRKLTDSISELALAIDAVLIGADPLVSRHIEESMKMLRSVDLVTFRQEARDELCEEICPKGRYFCTQKFGHQGDHVACDEKGKVIVTWSNA
jgi:hypothetical protein